MPLVGVFNYFILFPDRFKLRGLGGLGVERRTDPVALIMLVPGRHQHQPSLRNATTATVCQRETHRVTGVALELLHRWITDPAPRFPADVTPRPSGLWWSHGGGRTSRGRGPHPAVTVGTMSTGGVAAAAAWAFSSSSFAFLERSTERRQ